MRIAELERERLVMAEKLESEGVPKKRFEEIFELALRFLADPCSVWENGSLTRRPAVLTLVGRLVCCRNGGFRTPEMSIFSAC